MKVLICLLALLAVSCADTVTVKEQDRELRCMKACLGYQPVMDDGRPSNYCSSVLCNNERGWNKCLDSCR